MQEESAPEVLRTSKIRTTTLNCIRKQSSAQGKCFKTGDTYEYQCKTVNWWAAGSCTSCSFHRDTLMENSWRIHYREATQAQVTVNHLSVTGVASLLAKMDKRCPAKLGPAVLLNVKPDHYSGTIDPSKMGMTWVKSCCTVSSLIIISVSSESYSFNFILCTADHKLRFKVFSWAGSNENYPYHPWMTSLRSKTHIPWCSLNGFMLESMGDSTEPWRTYKMLRGNIAKVSQHHFVETTFL